jgi:hypothetical protein
MDTITHRVVDRFQQRSAKVDWLDISIPYDNDEVKGELNENLRYCTAYVKKCQYMVTLYRKIAEPLEVPKISTSADRLEKRAKDVEELMALLRELPAIANAVVAERDKLFRQIIKKEVTLRTGLMEAVQDLPHGKKLWALGKEAAKVHERIINEDAKIDWIDWTLEDYISSGSPVYLKIEKAAPGNFDINGAELPWGVWRWLCDDEILQYDYEEIQSELEEEEEE